jgi:hypothetical protein
VCWSGDGTVIATPSGPSVTLFAAPSPDDFARLAEESVHDTDLARATATRAAAVGGQAGPMLTEGSESSATSGMNARNHGRATVASEDECEQSESSGDGEEGGQEDDDEDGWTDASNSDGGDQDAQGGEEYEEHQGGPDNLFEMLRAALIAGRASPSLRMTLRDRAIERTNGLHRLQTVNLHPSHEVLTTRCVIREPVWWAPVCWFSLDPRHPDAIAKTHPHPEKPVFIPRFIPLIVAVRFSPYGSLLAAATAHGTVRFFHPQT